MRFEINLLLELREIFKILIKYGKIIIATGITFAAAAYLVCLYFPVRYRATANIYVQRMPDKPKLGDYTYDGYYAGKAAEAYTDTVVGFLQSLDVVKRAAEISNLSTEPENLLYYRRKIKVTKVAPQLIEISTLVRGKEQSKTLVKALAQATQERAQLLNQESENPMSIDLLNIEPLVQEIKPWKELYATVGFAVGLLLSVVGVFVFEYFKEEQSLKI
ncbi:MAG: hypothetical protein FJ044_05195 [Candidatus Cloacimonetes bacterium]|nr:hypothetical protein [Candidatus Cloacimonadota bacterium]